MTVTERTSLSYFDRNRIERAIDQAHDGLMPVSVEVKSRGQKFRVLVSKSTDKAKVLAEREERRAPRA